MSLTACVRPTAIKKSDVRKRSKN